MATIIRMGFMRHLRAEPNQYILHYRSGRLVREGAGVAYWFSPMSAAVAQLPVENCETTFVLRERTSDFQDVAVQCTIIYRVADPRKAAARVNFAISLATGAWLEDPPEKLAAFWAQRAQQPARAYVSSAPVIQAVQTGAEEVRSAISRALAADDAIQDMGLVVVGVQISQVSPTPEVEKALQTPTRESIQQKADEAMFQRRALAVEKERAIKENEMATEIELARQQEKLIQQKGANSLLEIQRQAEADRAKVEADAERQAVLASAYANDATTRGKADAETRRLQGQVDLERETSRVRLWEQAPNRVLMGLALQQLATNLPAIEHLNVTPDLVGQAITQLLRNQANGTSDGPAD